MSIGDVAAVSFFLNVLTVSIYDIYMDSCGTFVLFSPILMGINSEYVLELTWALIEQATQKYKQKHHHIQCFLVCELTCYSPPI